MSRMWPGRTRPPPRRGRLPARSAAKAARPPWAPAGGRRLSRGRRNAASSGSMARRHRGRQRWPSISAWSGSRPRWTGCSRARRRSGGASSTGWSTPSTRATPHGFSATTARAVTAPGSCARAPATMRGSAPWSAAWRRTGWRSAQRASISPHGSSDFCPPMRRPSRGSRSRRTGWSSARLPPPLRSRWRISSGSTSRQAAERRPRAAR